MTMAWNTILNHFIIGVTFFFLFYSMPPKSKIGTSNETTVWNKPTPFEMLAPWFGSCFLVLTTLHWHRIAPTRRFGQIEWRTSCSFLLFNHCYYLANLHAHVWMLWICGEEANTRRIYHYHWYCRGCLYFFMGGDGCVRMATLDMSGCIYFRRCFCLEVSGRHMRAAAIGQGK